MKKNNNQTSRPLLNKKIKKITFNCFPTIEKERKILSHLLLSSVFAPNLRVFTMTVKMKTKTKCS